ncbi:unnamed protein product [Nesidiocoris tenuis]|uniref:Uncharacterized protein n=1 Tax=Nesidiocoris tenuis TaxID=355587 RepID=A0A6H5FW81_9HEMI|nr:unnamed protein product [Nesidiocoris tenuis]
MDEMHSKSADNVPMCQLTMQARHQLKNSMVKFQRNNFMRKFRYAEVSEAQEFNLNHPEKTQIISRLIREPAPQVLITKGALRSNDQVFQLGSRLNKICRYAGYTTVYWISRSRLKRQCFQSHNKT